MNRFQNLLLCAGPRAPLPAPNTSAVLPRHADALVPDSAGSGTAGTSCPAHWPANAHRRANAANASLPADRRRCNNALAAAAAETSTRSPSRCTCDAVVGDMGLACSHPRRDTVYGPRELGTPARSSLGAELRAPLRGAFAVSSPPTHSSAEPVVSLSPPPELSPPCPAVRLRLPPPRPWRTLAAMRLPRHQLKAAQAQRRRQSGALLGRD
jgi:hypothetical protein